MMRSGFVVKNRAALAVVEVTPVVEASSGVFLTCKVALGGPISSFEVVFVIKEGFCGLGFFVDSIVSVLFFLLSFRKTADAAMEASSISRR